MSSVKPGRRQFLAMAAAPAVLRGRFRLFEQSETSYSSRAIELVGRAVVLDMLSPLTLDFEKGRLWMRDPGTFTEEDLRRYQDSGIRGFHIAMGLGGRDVRERALEFFGAWNGFLAHHRQVLLRVANAADFDTLATTDLVGILLGLQNSSHFREVDDVDVFHGLGQRVSQLTYNSRNLIGSGSTERSDGGLSDYGVSIVERMNAVGMAIDTSHCGDRTTLDAFEASKAPVLITHGNCRALADHPRCKTDEAIHKMAATGGVMGITGVRMFVRTEEPTTAEHVLDHFDHVRDLVGAEHLGLGSDIDLDGYDDMPEEQGKQLRAGYKGSYAFREKIDVDDLAHPKRVFDLAEGLLRRGYSDSDIDGVLGGNFRRVLSEIWERMSTPPKAINFRDKLARFDGHWAPRVIAEMNDVQFKLAKIQGEFVWHSHADTDEVFIVIEGEMSMELRDATVSLSEGEMFVVPKNVEHKPVAKSECHILLVEPRGIVNTGDAGGDRTAANDVWV